MSTGQKYGEGFGGVYGRGFDIIYIIIVSEWRGGCEIKLTAYRV